MSEHWKSSKTFEKPVFLLKREQKNGNDKGTMEKREESKTSPWVPT